MTSVHTVQADGVNVFYREVGPKNAPVILLLHGFPASSFMFRNLIPLLAEKYHVIAPDLPGFGFTVVPEERKYEYSFENIANTVGAFLDTLSIRRFAVYMFDYGSPVTIRLALSRPSAVATIVTQNGNAYEDGFGADFWAPLRQLWATNSPEIKENLRKGVLNLETTKWQYINGTPNADAIPPESYYLDAALLDRPGNGDIQLALLYDYRTNIDLYPQFHEFLKSSKVPVLAIWGKNDVIFIPPGAEAFKRDAADPEIHYIDSGHFALETNEGKFADLMVDFIQRRGHF